MNTDKQAILLKKTTALLVGTHDFRQLARQVTDLVVKELNDQNLVGAAIFRVHENENSLYAYTYANKYHKLIENFRFHARENENSLYAYTYANKYHKLIDIKRI